MIEDDYYDFDYYDPSQTSRERDTAGVGPSFTECSVCHTPLEQRRDLVVNKRLMRGKNISLTYSYRMILSEQMGGLLREHDLTGFDLRPVQHYRKPYKGEPSCINWESRTSCRRWRCRPPSSSSCMTVPFVAAQADSSSTRTGGERSSIAKTPNMYYPRSALEMVKDINHTVEYFGELRVAHPYVIITQRVYRLLREYKVKNWMAVPVYLVE